MGDFVRSPEPVAYFVDSTALAAIPDGAMLKWDTTNLEVALQAAGAAAECIGVAEGPFPITSNLGNGTAVSNRILVRSEGIFKFNTTASDSLKHGLAIEMGADSLTVKLGTPTAANKVGIVWLPKGETVTGAAGVTITIKLMPQYVFQS